MEDSQSDLFLESFTSAAAESYYTYTSPNASAGPSPTFSRRSQTFNVTNNLSLISAGALSGFSLDQSKVWNVKLEEVSPSIPWKSILFGFLLITGIVFITSFIIIFPRIEQEDGLPLTPTCLGIGTSVGDGYCDDELNSRTCDFDGGDCCLLNKSRIRCSECQCVFQETTTGKVLNTMDLTTTPKAKDIKKYGEVCEAPGENCYLTGAIQFGALSRNFWVYKPVWLGDGNQSITKCKVPLAHHSRTDLPSGVADNKPLVYNALAHSHENQEIYLCGGLGSFYQQHQWSIGSYEGCLLIKLSNVPGVPVQIGDLLSPGHQVDSLSMVVHRDHLWHIGGYQHYLVGDHYDPGCGYDTDYKYPLTYEYVSVMPLRGINASIYWDFYDNLKKPAAMTCTLSVGKYVYVIGGFNEYQRELDTVQYFDSTSMDHQWEMKDEKLVTPLFAHGCAITSLSDGRHVILTVGGFRYENVPAVRQMQ